MGFVEQGEHRALAKDFGLDPIPEAIETHPIHVVTAEQDAAVRKAVPRPGRGKTIALASTQLPNQQGVLHGYLLFGRTRELQETYQWRPDA